MSGGGDLLEVDRPTGTLGMRASGEGQRKLVPGLTQLYKAIAARDVRRGQPTMIIRDLSQTCASQGVHEQA